jgi:hypothetical protein
MAQTLLQLAAQTGQPLPQAFAELVTNVSVFARILNFIPAPGVTFPYGEVASLGSIAYRGINEDYPAGNYSVVNPKEERLAVFGGEVRTDHILIKAGLAMNTDARGNEIARRIRRAGLFFDNEVINGDGFTNPKAIVGLKNRLSGNQLKSAGTNGGALTLALLNQALDAVYGPNVQKKIICNRVVRRKIKDLVLAAAGGAAVADVNAAVPTYESAAIEEIDENGDDTPILPFTETQGSSNVTTSLYVVRPGPTTDREALQGLVLGSMVERRGGTDFGTYILDVVEAAMGIGVFHPRCASRVKGITNA